MKKYAFRFVTRQGQTGVVEVERDGVTERCLLPINVILEAKSELSGAQIDSGIPYGLPFGEFLDQPEVGIALHNVGIWTIKDLYAKAQAAVGSLSNYGLKLSEVIRLAENYEKEDHTVLKAAPAAHKVKRNKEIKHE
jgi:hypothetical protein